MKLASIYDEIDSSVYVTAGREKTTVESEYVQLNPLTDMTATLFENAITERKAVREAKDKFRS